MANGKILVTGGNGFVGSHLIDKLSKDNEVYIFDNKQNRIGYEPNATFLEGDVKNPEAISKLFPSDLEGIIHLAAVSRVVDGQKDPVECMHTNIVGTANVLEHARQNAQWFILGSTNELYHHNMYGLGKHTSELLTERYSLDFNVNSLVLKFASIYGSERDQRKLIPTIIDKAKKGEEITIDNGLKGFDFISVYEIVRGIQLGIDHIRENTAQDENGYFDKIPLCSGKITRIGNLAKEIIYELGSNSKLTIQSEEMDDFIKMDTAKAKDTISFTARNSNWVLY